MQLLPRDDQGKRYPQHNGHHSIDSYMKPIYNWLRETWNQVAYVAQRDEIIAQTDFESLPSFSKSALFHSRMSIKLDWNCESQQSLVNLLTSTVFTLLFVCLSSPWWHLHLSPSYDVLDHTNHIFSESLSSGDDNDRDEYLQKDKDTHTQTKISLSVRLSPW